MRLFVHSKLIMTFLLLLAGTFAVFPQNKAQEKLVRKAEKKLKDWKMPVKNVSHLGVFTIDSIAIPHGEKKIQLFFNKPLSYIPFREETVMKLNSSISHKLGRGFRNSRIEIITDGHKITELVPNLYRKNLPEDMLRISPEIKAAPSFITKPGHVRYNLGLDHKIIALWHSHGLYYEAKLDRWEWQRARLHSTVEDIFPMSFVLPYLAPMLENAGATVLIPRERDVQTNEVIVDNDLSTGTSEIQINEISPDTIYPGFRWKDTLFANENPFKLGSHLSFPAGGTGSLIYIPEIPENGDYAVYISYAGSSENIKDVKYTIRYSGGKAAFIVNQQMGAGTWICLGTFYFEKGKNRELGSVVVSSGSSASGRITSDAIKFGGGMGNVARRPAGELAPNQWSLKTGRQATEENIQINPGQFTWKISNKPRYLEAARYFLQYAGMPDSIVYSLNGGKNDYNDDYQSRGEWVNYLMGRPNGPSGHRNVKGLGIPVDLSLAFHTDAGVTGDDSIIGTLSIYSSATDKGRFPNGQSKMASRDLCDIVQTQIVNDVRNRFKAGWTRRGIWNKPYSEAYRPNVPAMLLELMSHQNLADMSLGLDPRFRFTVSRAIYKGMLRFLAFQEGKEYVVQPLPVDHFSISPAGGKKIKLSWSPVADPLEPTAIPQYYKIYQRNGQRGFDQGIRMQDTSIIIELEKYHSINSFKVTAVNEGGESFPSEILSVGIVEKATGMALVVNAFNRVSGPAIIDGSKFSGLAQFEDQGVPYIREIGQTGAVYDFNRKSAWLDDDSPGWGASYGNLEGKLIPGNRFDFPFIHGQAVMAAGMSFVSMSDETFVAPGTETKKYAFIDIIYGEEKAIPKFKPAITGDEKEYDFTVLSPGIRNKLNEVAGEGGNIFVSGAYIGTDPVFRGDTLATNFAEKVLHYKWRTNHAVFSGKFYATDYAKPFFMGHWNFNTSYHPELYAAEAPDAIEPAGKNALCAFRYAENNTSAGIAYKGSYNTVVLGFPFETIVSEEQRFSLMRQIIGFFKSPSLKTK